MREGTVTTEDLAIAAAKDKLVALPNAPGYADAMVPKPHGSRAGQIVMGSLAAIFAGLAVGAAEAITIGWLSTVFVVILVGLIIVALLGVLGFSRGKPAKIFGAAVLEKSGTDGLKLLAADGTEVNATATEGAWAAIRGGDVGVAHVRDTVLVEFRRL